LDPPGVLSVASPRLDDWSNVLGIVCSAASRLLLIKSAETGPSRTTWQVISSFGVLKSLEKLRTIQDPLVSLQFELSSHSLYSTGPTRVSFVITIST
jgi:hypothetical protein